MKHTLKSFLLAFVAMMVSIGAWGQMEVSVTFPASGYLTFYSPTGVTLPASVRAYAVERVEDDVMILVEKTDIAANSGAILIGEGEQTLTLGATASSDWSANLLDGRAVDTTIEGPAFVLGTDADAEFFVKADLDADSRFELSAMTAYLPGSKVTAVDVEKLSMRIETSTNNSCGENLTWNFSDGELVIEGTGAMDNFADGQAPWYAFKDEIVKLTIKSGVTSVGHYAFNECSKIADVVIPNGVTTLGTHAFGYCDGLTVVSLPPSVKTIGWSAFYTCQNLKTVNLSEGVTRIGEYSFADCRKLSVFNIPEGVTEIGQWAFRNCSFTSLILPSTLTAIQSYAFFDCNKLTSLTCWATTPPGLWGEAFATMNLSVPIYVPSTSVADYQLQEQWNAFTIKAVCSSESDHNFVNGICSVCGTYEAATDSNGDGTYEIGNAGQLFWFAEYVNSGNYSARAVLTADIDLENRPWTPIGYFNDAVDPYIDLHYRGIFDGQNHIIKNLNVHITDGSEAGFFSRTRDASLRNFGIVNATVISDPLGDKSSRAGVVGGELHYTTVDNVYTCGNITVITEYPQKGGIAGESSATRLNNCYTTYGILTPTKDVSVNNCFYLGNETNASSAGSFMTVEQMASGEMAYKLGEAYGQTIGTDALPLLGGEKVYYGYFACTDAEKVYTNNSAVSEEKPHNYVDGVCDICGEIYVPKLTFALTDEYGDGWNQGAIVVKKDGEAFAELTFDTGMNSTQVCEYDPKSEYTFYWKRGDYDSECSFLISLGENTIFTGLMNGNWCENTETPFHTIAACEATWGVSSLAQTSWGTITEAFAAAMAGNASYIQLHKDVEGVFRLRAGTFTLDVNGHLMLSPDDYVLDVEDTNLTITDSSAGEPGTLHNGNNWNRAVLAKRSTVYIERVNVIGAGAVEVLEASNVTIASGNYRGTYHPTIENKAGTLTILGGTFETTAATCVTSINSAVRTTISGGSFENGYSATIEYGTGVLDLSEHTNLSGVTVYNRNNTVNLDGTKIILPENCGFCYGEEIVTDALNAYTVYTIHPVYAVTFDANGGDGAMENTYTLGDYTLPECEYTAPEGQMFKAWKIAEVEYQPNAVVTMTENTTVTAVWATPYTLTFSANGGVGSFEAIKTVNVTLPACEFLAPEGKEFSAWRVDGVEYSAGSVVTLTENTVAYAVWKDATSVESGMFRFELFGMFIDPSITSELSYYTVMKDGELAATVKIPEDHLDASMYLEYDPCCEYAFYWHRGSYIPEAPHESPEVMIWLNDEEIYFSPGFELDHHHDVEQPFLIIPRKTQPSYVETLHIIDGELPEYLVQREAEVGTLTYSRTLPNTEWNALYVPFEIPVSELSDAYEVAYFNDMHSYDRNRDGEIDELEMEIILIDEGTLHANHPYFIRATSDDAKDLELVLNDVTICETENAQLTCSSVYTKFDLNGSYAKKSAAELEGCYAISTEGVWAPLADGTALNPFRFYLEITQLAGSPVKVSSHALQTIRIRLNGHGNTTEIMEVPITTTDAAVYDLSGRRVVNPGKGVYIVNGKKVMMK